MSSDRVLLRYTGELAKTFLDHCIGHVEPGGTFEVPKGEEERFTRRADVELAEAVPPVSGSSGKPKGGRRGEDPSAQDAQD